MYNKNYIFNNIFFKKKICYYTYPLNYGRIYKKKILPCIYLLNKKTLLLHESKRYKCMKKCQVISKHSYKEKKTIVVSIYLAMLSKIVVAATKPVEWKRLLEKCLFHGKREGVGKKWLCNKKEERKKRKKVRREIEFPSSFTPPRPIDHLSPKRVRGKKQNLTTGPKILILMPTTTTTYVQI